MSKNKKKKSWFEALCTMGEEPTSSNSTTRKKKKTTNPTATTRTRVQNRAADPYEDEVIPPFDSDSSTPIEDHLFDDVSKNKKDKSAGASRSTSNPNKSRATRSSSSSSRGRSGAGTREQNKPLPADIVYRIQPYLVLFFGGLLALMLLWSLTASNGTFEWTNRTHPFGFVGYYVEYFLFGLFGYGAFVLPAAMITLSILRFCEGSKWRNHGRSVAAAIILLVLPAMIHACMIGSGNAQLDTLNPGQLYTLGADQLGGGVLPGWLGWLCYHGLGVIATLIIGIAGILVCLMLIFRVTPARIANSIRAWRAARAERAEQARIDAEREEKKRAATPALPKAGRKNAQYEEDTEDPLMLPPAEESKGGKRRRAVDPEELVLRRKTARDEAEKTDEVKYLDPTAALLAGNGKRRKRTGKEPEDIDEFTPETVFPDAVAREPLEYVSAVTSTQENEVDRTFFGEDYAPKAPVIPPQYEPEGAEETATLLTYPDHAEIELDEDSESIATTVALEETADYQSGFDYSMESSDGEDGDLDDDDIEMIGGVAVRVEKLSEEERERGEKIAEPQEEEEIPPRPYTYPRVDLLDPPKPHNAQKDQEVRIKMQKLNATLTNFKVRVDGISYVCGPAVTRYEVRPAPGVRVRSIANLADDIAMSLAAKSIRIEAPIPGKEAVGIEVPNTTRETVYLRRLIDSEEFRARSSKLTACLGEDVAGTPILFDIVKMPHLLVAGTTGSGKSVCINDFLMSLVFKATPKEVKVILIDPKQVEFTVYKDLPHLMAPIVCDPKRAAAALNLAVLEMEKRFQMIKEVGVRNIGAYNEITENDRYEHPYMNSIVIVIDELADLMMQAKDEVETSIVRLAQKGRAAGIHLIIGTQRPSVDVITGLIKANIPSRIACTVVSQVDSRTILDVAGAEKLLGMGDMLYAPIGSPKPLRVQGAFVSDDEVERIVTFIKKNNDPVRYDQEFLDNLDREAQMIGTKRQPGADDAEDGEESADGMDPKFYEALRIALDNKRISTSLLQRMLSIGYGRAAKIIDQMERMGFVGPAVGNKPREIRITEQGYAELMMNKD